MELKIVELDKEIKAKLQTPFPAYIIKQKPGKGANNYVTGQSVIDKLNASFGYAGWSWEIVERWTEDSIDKITKTKWDNGKSTKLPKEQWIIEPQLPVAHIVGRLTVFFERLDGTIHTVSKMAPGSQPIVEGQSNQENCYKGAHTDAIKKAATLFGVALELYRDENEQYCFNEMNYENPWTEEAMEEHKDNFAYLSEFKKKYGLSDEDMSGYINTFSAGTLPTIDYLMPDNATAFVKYLQDLVNAQAGEQKGA